MKRRPRHRAAILAAALAAGFIALALLDERIYHLIDPTLASRRRLEGRIWYTVLRNVGSFWTWLVIGIGVLCADRIGRKTGPGNASPLRGPSIAISAGAAGLGAELLKLVIARERPATIQDLGGGIEALVYQGHHFRGLFAGFADGSNLGLPSSHAATAAGGAFAVALLWPRLGPPAIALALGCGLTRLLTGAHFATDVYAGIVLGWLVAWGLRRAFPPAPRGEETA